MKPNFVDPDLTHSRADVAAQNRETDRLCAAILPLAQTLVEQAVAHYTAQAADAVLAGEAEAMLQSMLAEFDDSIAPLPDQTPEPQPLYADIAADDIGGDDEQWIARLAGDFALAAAAFWQDLSPAETDLVSRQDVLITHLREGRHDDLLAAFDLIAARFYVGEHGRALLTALNDLTQPVYVMLEEVSPFSAEPHILAGVISTST